jgi:CDP-diacylglycerol--glycerol-3-phosphate 3-phosphatidyltransferase
MLAVPVLIVTVPWNVSFFNWIAALVFGAAAITDFLDGYIARQTNSESELGALLDPMADKILAVGGLVMLASVDRIPEFLVIALLSRDLAISALRLAASERGLSIPVSMLGKGKTAVQDLGIFCLLTGTESLSWPGLILTWVGAGLSLYSGYDYWNSFWEQQKGPEAPLAIEPPQS